MLQDVLVTYILQADLKQPHLRYPSIDFAFIVVSSCVAKKVSKGEKYEMYWNPHV